MGLLRFENLPVNTLIGADRATFDKVTGTMKPDAPYFGKARRTK